MMPVELTVELALAAIRDGLSPALARALDEAPDDFKVAAANMILEGGASAKMAAEALTFAAELGVANERGELTEEQGLALVEKLAMRQLGLVEHE